MIITYHRILLEVNTQRTNTNYGTEEDCFLPDAIFTTGSVMGTLTGRGHVFIGSRRPITPLLSWDKTVQNIIVSTQRYAMFI